MSKISEFVKAVGPQAQFVAKAKPTPCCSFCGKPAFTGDTKAGSVGSAKFLRFFNDLKPLLVQKAAYACVECVPALHEALVKANSEQA